MPLSAVLLVAVSTVLHAGWNARLHRAADPQVVIALAYLSVGVVLLPAAVVDPPDGVLLMLLGSTVAQAVYMWLLGSAYGSGSLGIAYPISRGTAPLLVGIGGWLLLDETPSVPTVTGLVLLMVGLLGLAGLGSRRSEGRAVALAAVSGLATVGYSLIDAEAVDRTSPLGYLAPIMIISALAVLTALRPTSSRLRAAFRPGLLVGLGQGAAYVLVLLAFQRAQAGQVAGLRQLSVVLGVLLAREALGRRAFTGAVLVTLGAALVVW